MDAPVYVFACGVTLIVSALTIALWFIPTLVALRKVRSMRPESIVFVGQRTRGLQTTLTEMGVLADVTYSSVPTYVVVAVSYEPIEIWRPTSSSVIARVEASSVVRLGIETVTIRKAVPALVFTGVGPSGSPSSIMIIPCRRGSELMAMNGPQAAELLAQVSERMGPVRQN
jgi:hypothetical protein